MSRFYSLRFFAADAKNCIIPLSPVDLSASPVPSVGTDDAHYMWYPLMQRIATMLQDHIRISNVSTVVLEPIQILFVQTEHLTSKIFLDNLSGSQAYVAACDGKTQVALRQTRPTATGDENPAKPEQSETIKKIPLHPIITIGYPDITRIYEDSPSLDFETEGDTKYWQDVREGSAWLYHLDLDRRVKFLDSSIWHRYVAYEGAFDGNFKKVLHQVIEYYDLRLYQSLAGLATLEFECRMLQNAFIAQYGTRGHHEVITPFEFHSETAMERKAEKFMAFFEEERNGTRLADLYWNVLLVDDHADQNISTEERNAEITKRDLIQRWITDFDRTGADPEQPKKRLNVTIEKYTKGDSDIINQATKLLEDNTFDLILLDYLLGDSDLQQGLKAYGHEFLLELATHREQSRFRRGPFGRYWIFPISSFPFAFTDKLKQLNMDGSSERWYIASGGDPITTPALFRLNFYRLLLRQISECYLHEAAMVRQIERYNAIKDREQWCEAIKHRIDAELYNRKLLSSERDEISVFAESMDIFLDKQKKYQQFWERLRNWIQLFRGYQEGKPATEYFKDLSNIAAKYGEYANICKHIRSQAEKFVADSEKKFIELVKAVKEGNPCNKIEYLNSNLYNIPVEFFNLCPKIQELHLAGNKIISVSPDIQKCTGLKVLNLSNNNDLISIPAAALLLNQNLRTLNLRDTKIGHDLEGISPFANTFDEVRALLEYIASKQAKKASASNQSVSDPVNIFISYAQQDLSYKKDLVKHLFQFKDMIWADDQMLGGEYENEIIKSQMAKADIILFLLSVDLLNSARYNEIEKPEAKKCQEKNDASIITIYLRDCDIKNLPFTNSKILPDGDDKPVVSSYYGDGLDKPFTQIAVGVRQVVERKRLLRQ